MRTRIKVLAGASALALGVAGGGIALADGGTHDGGLVPGDFPAFEANTVECVDGTYGDPALHTAENGWCNIPHNLPEAPFAVVLTAHEPLGNNSELPYQLGWSHSGDPDGHFSVRALNTRGEIYSGTFTFSYAAYSGPAQDFTGPAGAPGIPGVPGVPGVDGVDGADGQVAPPGATIWEIDVDYAIGDIVYHDGAYWQTDAVATLNEEPGVAPNWVLFV